MNNRLKRFFDIPQYFRFTKKCDLLDVFERAWKVKREIKRFVFLGAEHPAFATLAREEIRRLETMSLEKAIPGWRSL